MPVLDKIKSDYISWFILIGCILLLLEVTFFNKGLIFSLLVAVGMIYFGRKAMPGTFGKILFWSGLIFFFASIIGMMTFRFFLLAILVHFVIQYSQSKRKPEQINPVLKEPVLFNSEEEVVRKKPLFDNVLFGQQKTPERVYEWNDINIQAGFGDTVIDLSYTVLPPGETVVFIRNFIGNVQILVPYDLEVSIHHSVIAGSIKVFNFQEPKAFNRTFLLQTPGYETQEQKIKIFTSLIVGDVEVKRV
ncbi:cell wall-active antibiotics response protein [Bacillus canaveralius]|nr:cell wall-active antibiotics response protein [Bacillus canaveralius]